MARECRPKPGTGDIASPYSTPVMRLWRDQSEVLCLPNAKLLRRKTGQGQGPGSEKGAAYRGKKRMVENYGLCGYFQAVVRSEQHFYLFGLDWQLRHFEYICTHLPLVNVQPRC